jgi:mannose-6-phosphate isomerase-like protein (cupin superfamily)
MKSILTIVILLASNSLAVADVISGTREVLLDNATVEVVRLTYPAGSESGMHTHEHPYRAAYVIQGGKLELVPADSRQPSQVLEVADGQALFLPATTHNVRNIGATEVVIIETEIK